MRILVLSDMHHRKSMFCAALEAQPEATHVLYLGDGTPAAEELAAAYPDRDFYFVCGNCDFNSMQPAKRILTLGGKKILMTHGHLYGVKSTTENIKNAALSEGCKIAVFGHTHQPLELYSDGVYLLNPGALCGSSTKPSYGIIEISAAGIMTNICYL